MTPEERKRMDSLCARIQEERDYPRFEELTRELNDLVRRKELRFPQHGSNTDGPAKKAWRTLPAVVQKIVKSAYSNQVEKIEITIPAAEDLFREIRIENNFTGEDGQSVALRTGAELDVTFEAEAKDIVPQKRDGGHA